MNEYVRYENMRYEMAECAEVVRRALGLTVPVSIKDLIPILKSGFFTKTTQTTRFRLYTMQKSTKKTDFLPGFDNG